MSDDQGRFELSGLPEANCHLIARKDGFVTAVVDGGSAYGLRIRDGENRDGLEVQLARGVTLSGRILDDKGAPAVGVRIHPVRREMVDGRERLTPVAYGPTQAGGRFRTAGLPPGDYYLGAGPPPAVDKAAANGLVLTYFPGVTAIGKATLIRLKAGETRDVEIALKRAPGFEVSGQVIDASGNPVPDASMTLAFAEPPQFMRGSTRSQADGSFALKNVHPGDYALDVGPRGAKLADLARLRITVDGDISNLIVRIALGNAAAVPTVPRPAVDWPQFRGIAAGGVAEGFSLPEKWNAADGTNILWKTPIPGLGLSSPIVWGDDIFLSTSISGKTDASLKVGYYGDITPVQDDTSHEWRVYALDKKTGQVKWQQTAYKGVPKIKRHMKNSHANSTLATDGERVVAFFGSEGLYAYDMKGTLLWKKDLGVLDAGYYMVPDAQWETGSSPILHDGMVIVQADVQKGSFLAMFDAKDGREVWRVTRADVPTWSTPTIHVVNGQTQILVNGMRHVGAYDFKTGKEIWKLSGGGDIPVPTPVVSDGLVYITNAHGPASPVYAIKETATGDISLKGDATSSDGVAWTALRTGGCSTTVGALIAPPGSTRGLRVTGGPACVAGAPFPTPEP